MQTMDQALARLLSLGKIGEQTASAMTRNPALLKDWLRSENGRRRP